MEILCRHIWIVESQLMMRGLKMPLSFSTKQMNGSEQDCGLGIVLFTVTLLGDLITVLVVSLIEYKTLMMRGDLEWPSQILPSIPKEHLNSVAHFLESRGMLEDALEVATDPNYRFDLAIPLGRLNVAKAIAVGNKE